ncbi:hypothetical protein BO71DRAFT_413989 [Aspergillus ellipticus CBS 707.79]|uniref:Uncharacterized protein n=1 Tax=Aspergillus ellipticus CBS 707.79 TaxID=1448320 RepID=A0A319EBR7_9EURO|nr:hypothetical protein BO71DRAFT_413989 [Aspergillus ellipticus CBS 707.79]
MPESMPDSMSESMPEGSYNAEIMPRRAWAPWKVQPTAREDIGNPLVEKISYLFEQANIPNLVWGKHLLAAYRVPDYPDKFLENKPDIYARRELRDTDRIYYMDASPDESISFIVPDELYDQAVLKLDELEFEICRGSYPPYLCGCILNCNSHHKTMIPTIHFRLVKTPRRDNEFYALGGNPRFCATKDYGKYDKVTLKSPRPLPYVSRNYRPVETGYRWHAPIVPKPAKVMEALILLRCRDEDYHSHCDANWGVWLDMMVDHLLRRGVVRLTDLQPCFRPILEALMAGEVLRSRRLIKQLRKKLREEGTLPPPLLDRKCACGHWARDWTKEGEYGEGNLRRSLRRERRRTDRPRSPPHYEPTSAPSVFRDLSGKIFIVGRRYIVVFLILYKNFILISISLTEDIKEDNKNSVIKLILEVLI